ncbi:MAG: transcription elongation factor GreA [Bdellovibrionales bacterium]|nr:transcription elongation factor GreA [Bdellovibrionales bacterium]
MSDKVPMTLNGKRLLEEELRQLLSVERPTVVKAIEVARANGDLSENADYSAAKERQSFIEGRIMEINAKIAAAQVIDPKTIKSEKVVFGAQVKLLDVDKDEKVEYAIVGVDEADAKSGKISITSPIARALIGKSVGDEVVVNAPKGKYSFEILEISYG